MTDNPKTPGSTSSPTIQQQNNQGQGSLARGSDTYQPHATDGWNGKKSGSTSKDSKPFG